MPLPSARAIASVERIDKNDGYGAARIQQAVVEARRILLEQGIEMRDRLDAQYLLGRARCKCSCAIPDIGADIGDPSKASYSL
jgi:hypothetical protein